MSKQELIESIKKRLRDAYNPREIYLFGSFAWGVPDEQSDLDILVIVERSDEKPHRRIVKGLECLQELRMPKDIIVLTTKEFELLAEDASTLFHKVKKSGIKIYEAA